MAPNGILRDPAETDSRKNHKSKSRVRHPHVMLLALLSTQLDLCDLCIRREKFQNLGRLRIDSWGMATGSVFYQTTGSVKILLRDILSKIITASQMGPKRT
jgi:hypothetical protein